MKYKVVVWLIKCLVIVKVSLFCEFRNLVEKFEGLYLFLDFLGFSYLNVRII